MTLSIENFKWNFQANPKSEPSDDSGGACVASQPQCQGGQLFNPFIKSAYPLPVNAVLQCKRLGQNHRSTQPFHHRLKKPVCHITICCFSFQFFTGQLNDGHGRAELGSKRFWLKKIRNVQCFELKKMWGFLFNATKCRKSQNQGLILPKLSLQAIRARSQKLF